MTDDARLNKSDCTWLSNGWLCRDCISAGTCKGSTPARESRAEDGIGHCAQGASAPGAVSRSGDSDVAAWVQERIDAVIDHRESDYQQGVYDARFGVDRVMSYTDYDRRRHYMRGYADGAVKEALIRLKDRLAAPSAAHDTPDVFFRPFDCHFDGDISKCDKDCQQLGVCKRRTSTPSSTERDAAPQGLSETAPSRTGQTPGDKSDTIAGVPAAAASPSDSDVAAWLSAAYGISYDSEDVAGLAAVGRKLIASSSRACNVVEECAKRCDAVAEFIRSANVNAKAAIHAAEQCAAEVRKVTCAPSATKEKS